MEQTVDKIAQFWNCFQQYEQKLKHWGDLKAGEWDHYFNRLEQLLHDYCGHICFLLEIEGEECIPCGLILTAHADANYFQYVMDLANAAPYFPGWRISALRNKAPVEYCTDMEELNIDPRQLEFAPLFAGKVFAGVRVFIPKYDFSRQKEYEECIRSMMINMMGEAYVGYFIWDFEVVNLPVTRKLQDLYPFMAMPDFVESWFNSDEF